MIEDYYNGTSLYRPSRLTSKRGLDEGLGVIRCQKFIYMGLRKSGILVAEGHSLLRAVFH